MKYIFDDIFQIYFKNIFTLFVCDIHSHLRYVYIPKLPQYNYTYVLTLFILKLTFSVSQSEEEVNNHNKVIPQPWSVSPQPLQ